MKKPIYNRNLLDTQSQPNVNWKRTIIAFCILVLVFLGYYFYDYYSETGLYPISRLNKSESILPPDVNPINQTFDDVMLFIQNDDTDKETYQEGFVCVESALLLCRQAQWNGLAGYPVMLTFQETDIKHMVVVFPTKDRGDVVIETLTDQQIRPRVGRSYKGKEVTGIYLMGINWIPLEGSPVLEPSYTVE